MRLCVFDDLKKNKNYSKYMMHFGKVYNNTNKKHDFRKKNPVLRKSNSDL